MFIRIHSRCLRSLCLHWKPYSWCYPSPSSLQVPFFGIFDAHKGEGVAKYLQDNLFNNILNEGGVRADPVGATRDAYLLTDRNILDTTSEKGGSTAVTAMVCECGSRLIVANVGLRCKSCKRSKCISSLCKQLHRFFQVCWPLNL